MRTTGRPPRRRQRPHELALLDVQPDQTMVIATVNGEAVRVNALEHVQTLSRMLEAAHSVLYAQQAVVERIEAEAVMVPILVDCNCDLQDSSRRSVQRRRALHEVRSLRHRLKRLRTLVRRHMVLNEHLAYLTAVQDYEEATSVLTRMQRNSTALRQEVGMGHR
jgi:hypothetical protein